MTLAFDDFQKIRRRVEAAKARRDRAEGALGQLLARLKKEFGVATVEEARKLLDELIAKEAEAAKVYAKARAAFLKKWKDKVGGDDDES